MQQAKEFEWKKFLFRNGRSASQWVREGWQKIPDALILPFVVSKTSVKNWDLWFLFRCWESRMRHFVRFGSFPLSLNCSFNSHPVEICRLPVFNSLPLIVLCITTYWVRNWKRMWITVRMIRQIWIAFGRSESEICFVFLKQMWARLSDGYRTKK